MVPVEHGLLVAVVGGALRVLLLGVGRVRVRGDEDPVAHLRVEALDAAALPELVPRLVVRGFLMELHRVVVLVNLVEHVRALAGELGDVEAHASGLQPALGRVLVHYVEELLLPPGGDDHVDADHDLPRHLHRWHLVAASKGPDRCCGEGRRRRRE